MTNDEMDMEQDEQEFDMTDDETNNAMLASFELGAFFGQVVSEVIVGKKRKKK
jgi:hypothetical protein